MVVRRVRGEPLRRGRQQADGGDDRVEPEGERRGRRWGAMGEGGRDRTRASGDGPRRGRRGSPKRGPMRRFEPAGAENLARRRGACYSAPATVAPPRRLRNDIDAAGLAARGRAAAALARRRSSPTRPVTGTAPGHVARRASRARARTSSCAAASRAALTTPCARCLEPARRRRRHRALAAPPAGPGRGARTAASRKPAERGEDEYEFTSDRGRPVDTYDGETVVLDPFVREAILLEVPNFPLCSEGCPGIRPAARAGPRRGPWSTRARPAPRARSHALTREAAGRAGAPERQPRRRRRRRSRPWPSPRGKPPQQAQHAPRAARQGDPRPARQVRALRRGRRSRTAPAPPAATTRAARSRPPRRRSS